MKTVCEQNKCAGCMLCSDICPSDAINIKKDIEAYNAIIDESKCIGCDLCHKSCPQAQPVELHAPIEWHQGWCGSEEIRSRSSSGGAAAAISRRFIENGGKVCTCKFEKGRFGFTFFDDVGALASAAGSKYVKSDPGGIYKPLLQMLRSGEKVLMIGLPCQIAAAKRYTERYAENFYTVDLICHGTPDPKVLELYLKGKDIDLNTLSDIRFRKKTSFGLADDYTELEKFYTDEYTYAFLHGMTYTDNCYECRYAKTNRVADITLGDSWGSELGDDEKKKGISLILVQNEKGAQLIRDAGLLLREVDPDKAAASNKQLQKPSRKPEQREKFIDAIQSGKGFGKAMLSTDPKRYLKNMIKKYVIKKCAGGYGLTVNIPHTER